MPHRLVAVAPDLAQQLALGEHPLRLGGKVGEEQVLIASQLDAPAGEEDLLP
jgi:hypothetical protein